MGLAKRMLAGGSEGPSPFIWAGFDAMRVICRKFNEQPEAASRPMSATASGFVPGSGAAVLVLEDLESALERGAKIYAEILGGAVNCGGHRMGGSITAPNPEGVKRCRTAAMAPPPSSAKDQENGPFRVFQRGRNYALPKSTCPNRSEWRVLPGKAPERLSPYYQLGCEFGSALILSWRNEGSEPVYVCGEHAKEFEYSGVRASASGRPNETSKNGDQEISSEGEPDPVPVAVPIQESPATPRVADSVLEAPRKAIRSGRSPAEQNAAIDQLIRDLTTQLETAFSQSEVTINVMNAIDAPLEQATLAVISDPAMAETQKDAAVQALGALQESLKQGAGPDITLLQAHQIRQVVQHRLSGESGLVEEAKAGYRAVHDSLESAIRAAAPKAKHLEERLANLLKMKDEMDNSSKARELTPVVA